MAHLPERKQNLKGESANRSSVKNRSENSSTKGRRANDDEFNDFQTSWQWPPNVKSAKASDRGKYIPSSDRYGSRLPLSKHHSEIKRDQRPESKLTVPRQKSLKLSSSSARSDRDAPVTTPLSGGKANALSFLKKGSPSSLASATDRQHQDLFAASLGPKAKIKLLNPFAVSSTNAIKPDHLTLPPSRKNKRKRDNDTKRSIDEIKARMITVSALDHSTEPAKSKCCFLILPYHDSLALT
jgi:hypothetical protein